MASVFVDTSAILALLDAEERNHQLARAALSTLQAAGDRLVTHSYVLSEASALVQRRLGQEFVADFHRAIEPLFVVVWVDAELHRLGVAALVAAARGSVGIVDWTSFAVMRRLGIRRAFAFDKDFRDQGFDTIPGG